MKRNMMRFGLITSMASLSAAAFALDTVGGSGIKFAELYANGGDFSHLLVAIAVIVFVLFIIKFIQLFVKEKLDTKKFYLKLKGYIKNEQFDEAIKISQNFKNTTMGHIFWNGLLNYNDARKKGKKSKELQAILENSFNEAGLQLIPKIESRLFWFDIFGQIATLLGLLGTIWGLIEAFNSLANADDTMKQKLLTQGIYKSMSTTGLGLMIAIPTMVLKGFLQSRAEAIVNDIDEYSVKTINQITNSIAE